MKTPIRYWLCLGVALAIFIGFPSHALHAAELHVFAAASLSDALNEIAPAFSKQTGTQVQFNFAGSGLLARQIAEGAPADLFFSADEGKMDSLEKKGLLAAGSRKSLLSNTLVVIVPLKSALDLRSATDLPKVKALAMGDPSTVPAGEYGRAFLTGAGLWESLKDRIIPLENVRATLAVVEGENADAGIVYKTDALLSKKVKIAFEVPSGPHISYPVAIVGGTKAPKESQAFEEYLASPQATGIFTKFGFLIEPKKP